MHVQCAREMVPMRGDSHFNCQSCSPARFQAATADSRNKNVRRDERRPVCRPISRFLSLVCFPQLLRGKAESASLDKTLRLGVLQRSGIESCPRAYWVIWHLVSCSKSWLSLKGQERSANAVHLLNFAHSEKAGLATKIAPVNLILMAHTVNRAGEGRGPVRSDKINVRAAIAWRPLDVRCEMLMDD